MPPAADERKYVWSMAVHLSALTVFLGIPLANLFFPWLIAFWKGRKWPEVAHAGVESLNFQLTATLCGLASLAGGLFSPVGWLGVLGVGGAVIVFSGIAADRARGGEPYRYPLRIRFLRSVPLLPKKQPASGGPDA